jgi:hypothetical protein
MEQFADNVGTPGASYVPESKGGIGRRAFVQASFFAAAITVIDVGAFQKSEKHTGAPIAERSESAQPQPQIVMPRGFAMPSLIGGNMRLYKGRLI